jgi:hypothetical protein
MVPPESHLISNGLNILFDNNVKCLGVIVDERITWRLHIERIEVKAFRTFIRLYSLLKSEQLNANTKLTLLEALIRPVITSFPAWEFAVETHLYCSACKTGFFAPL